MHEDILGMWVTRLRCVAPLGCALLGHNTSIFAPFSQRSIETIDGPKGTISVRNPGIRPLYLV